MSQRMAALIEQGEFLEGSRLPAEAELATRFGVSRPVIREALSRLRTMGFITSRKGSGSYVQRRAPPDDTPPPVGFGPLTSLAQVRRCYEFRMSLEGDAAYYAAQNRSDAVLAVMKEALDGMQGAINQGVAGMDADLDFHLAVTRASGNEFFEAVMQSMRRPLEFAVNLARNLTLTRPREHMLLVQGEHVAIFEAIAAGDRDAARGAMRRHIQNARWRVFEGPDSPPEPPADPAGDMP
ncbi:MAG: FadR family transcriptional regulator [Rhizobiales bacterium]|nr:FadR family transcriptional regulator [Hyphomicrobiales bacterium]